MIELLVAIGLLALLATVLIMIFTDSLALWSEGETQRKQYEEAHYILREISNDLRQTWIPVGKQSRSVNNADSMSPFLLSGFNQLEGAPFPGRWLDVVRTRPGYLTGNKSLKDARRFQRRIYVLLPGKGLFRSTSPADESFGHHKNPERMSDSDYVENNFDLIGPNVLYVDFRFWGPWMELGDEFALTDRWPAAKIWGNDNNVSLVWDSSRKMADQFRMYNPEADTPAVPAMVRVRLELTSDQRSSWPQLTASLGPDVGTDQEIPLSDASKLPTSGYVRIGDEWIRVNREGDRVLIRKRGARESEPSAHDPGEKVRAGTGFETTVFIPVYPGRSYYVDRLNASESGTR